MGDCLQPMENAAEVDPRRGVPFSKLGVSIPPEEFSWNPVPLPGFISPVRCERHRYRLKWRYHGVYGALKKAVMALIPAALGW